MGVFEKRRQATAAKRHAARLSAWETEADMLGELLRALDRGPSFEVDGLALKRGEGVLMNYHGSALVEPRRAPGHYVGGYSGFSFQIAKGVRYHTGGSRGRYVPGPDVVTVIDTGSFAITDRRVLFRGVKQAREWSFEKLLGWTHDAAEPLTYLQVANRQKVSGFSYAPEHVLPVRFRLAWALALRAGRADHLRRDVEAQLAAHQAARPMLGP